VAKFAAANASDQEVVPDAVISCSLVAVLKSVPFQYLPLPFWIDTLTVLTLVVTSEAVPVVFDEAPAVQLVAVNGPAETGKLSAVDGATVSYVTALSVLVEAMLALPAASWTPFAATVKLVVPFVRLLPGSVTATV